MKGKYSVSSRLFYVTSVTAVVCLLFSASCSKKKIPETPAGNTVVIWTYDSFISEWGPGEEAAEVFKNRTGITINWISHGDAGTMLSRLLSEGANSNADVILGLDQNLAKRALDSGLFNGYRPRGAEHLFPELIFDSEYRLVPFDYSYFAIVYDSEKIPMVPASLEDLTNPVFGKSLILIDPRTSTPGLGFFGWVKEVYGSNWQDYWKRLDLSILTITEGWSSAYGLFTRGEAPMVLSYTTSPGVHLEYEQTERYKAALFTDGHPLQIEAAGILKAAKNRRNAETFLDFMVSEDFQNIIPLTNWMYPVIDIPLPDSFRINTKSDKPLLPDPATEPELNEWAALMTSFHDKK